MQKSDEKGNKKSTAGAGGITHKNLCCQLGDSHLEESEEGKDLDKSAGQSFTTELPVVKQPRKKQGEKKPKKPRKKLKGTSQGIASKCREILKPGQ